MAEVLQHYKVLPLEHFSGVFSLQAVDWYSSRPVRNWLHRRRWAWMLKPSWNHPLYFPPQCKEKLSSMKPVSGAKKVGEPLTLIIASGKEHMNVLSGKALTILILLGNEFSRTLKTSGRDTIQWKLGGEKFCFLSGIGFEITKAEFDSRTQWIFSTKGINYVFKLLLNRDKRFENKRLKHNESN